MVQSGGLGLAGHGDGRQHVCRDGNGGGVAVIEAVANDELRDVGAGGVDEQGGTDAVWIDQGGGAGGRLAEECPGVLEREAAGIPGRGAVKQDGLAHRGGPFAAGAGNRRDRAGGDIKATRPASKVLVLHNELELVQPVDIRGEGGFDGGGGAEGDVAARGSREDGPGVAELGVVGVSRKAPVELSELPEIDFAVGVNELECRDRGGEIGGDGGERGSARGVLVADDELNGVGTLGIDVDEGRHGKGWVFKVDGAASGGGDDRPMVGEGQARMIGRERAIKDDGLADMGDGAKAGVGGRDGRTKVGGGRQPGRCQDALGEERWRECGDTEKDERRETATTGEVANGGDQRRRDALHARLLRSRELEV